MSLERLILVFLGGLLLPAVLYFTSRLWQIRSKFIEIEVQIENLRVRIAQVEKQVSNAASERKAILQALEKTNRNIVRLGVALNVRLEE